MALLIAIVALVVLPWQWKIAEATDGSEWKLTVHKIPYHKFDYLLHCIHDLSTSPSLVEYRFKCTLSWRGRSISSRTFWWPSCYPKNIKIVSMNFPSDGNGKAVIRVDDFAEVHCLWSHDHTLWEEVNIN
jgi:hypothetical protein